MIDTNNYKPLPNCLTINDSFIKLTPFEDEALTEESGSIAHEIIFPLKEIKLLIKVNMEVIKENAKQTV